MVTCKLVQHSLAAPPANWQTQLVSKCEETYEGSEWVNLTICCKWLQGDWASWGQADPNQVVE